MSTYISHVSAHHLKGRSFQHELSPLTLVTGPNFIGKTCILDTIRLALLGYIPEIGKTNKSTFELASGQTMAAAVVVEESGVSRSITRTFRLEKGSVKAEATGEEKRFITPLLDAEAYFELSERDRIDYVFERVTMPDTYTVAGILARLERLSFGEDHSEEVEQAKSEVIGRCRETFEEPENANVAEAISLMADEVLKEDATLWKRKADDTQGAIRVMTELKNREEHSAETLTDLRNAEAHLAAQIDECNRETGAIRARAAEALKLKARHQALEAALATPEPDWTPPEKPAVQEPELIEVEPLLEKLRVSEKRVEEVGLTAPEARDRIYGLNATIQSDEIVLAHQQAKSDAVLQRLEMVSSRDHCPTCGSALTDKNALVAKLTAKAEQARANIQESKQEIARLKLARDESIAMTAASNAALAELDSTGVALAEARRANELKIDAYERALEAVAIRHAHELDLLTLKRQQWQRQREADQAEHERLAFLVEPDAAEVAAATAKASEIMAQLNEARAKVLAAEKLQQDILRASQALREHQLCAARVTVIKEARKTLNELKGEMVNTAFGSLLGNANKFVAGILKHPLHYEPQRNEIGFLSPDGFIAHRTFSGTEKTLAYLAIAAALSAQAEFRLMIIDEIARLTPKLQESVLERLELAVKDGWLDQVICVIPLDAGQYYAREGWRIIDANQENNSYAPA